MQNMFFFDPLTCQGGSESLGDVGGPTGRPMGSDVPIRGWQVLMPEVLYLEVGLFQLGVSGVSGGFSANHVDE